MAGQERTRLSGLVASAAVVITALNVLPGSGAADTEPGGRATSLLGTASAQGMRITYTVPDFLVVSEVIDGGGPVAQSLLETGGQSTAFASLPYPGENGVGGPALLLGLLGQSPPGSYPFYVRADSTVNPTVELRDPSGSYALRATAEAQKAIGTADVAFGAPDQPASSAAAHTEVLTAADGRMTVTAESLFRGLSLAEGLLRIASVESRSVTVYGPGETDPKTATQLIVDGARVGDQAVTIGPDGVQALGAPLPAPTGGPDLNRMLAQGGLTVRTVSAGAVKGGGAADALEIVSDHGIPVPGLPRGVLSLRIGGATTALSVGSMPSLEATPGLPTASPEGGSDHSTAPPTVGAPAGDPPQVAGAGSHDVRTTDDVPVLPPPAVSAAFGTGTDFSGNSQELGLFPPSSSADSGSSAPVNQRPPRRVSSQSALAPEARALYLLLVIAGVGAIVLSFASRVRRTVS
jgi:hypothetical protein